jgi:hypothetical protein
MNTYNGMFFSLKKEGTPSIYHNINKYKGNYVK